MVGSPLLDRAKAEKFRAGGKMRQPTMAHGALLSFKKLTYFLDVSGLKNRFKSRPENLSGRGRTRVG